MIRETKRKLGHMIILMHKKLMMIKIRKEFVRFQVM